MNLILIQGEQCYIGTYLYYEVSINHVTALF
jgi:hypothetical protein